MPDNKLNELCREVHWDDGLTPVELHKHLRRSQQKPKTHHRHAQYCHAAAASLDLDQLPSLPDSLRDRCRVLEVLPEGDGPGGALLVIVGLELATVAQLEATEHLLNAERGLLRMLIAESTTRRRTPHVKVRVVPMVG